MYKEVGKVELIQNENCVDNSENSPLFSTYTGNFSASSLGGILIKRKKGRKDKCLTPTRNIVSGTHIMMPREGEIRRAAVDPENMEWIRRKFNCYKTEITHKHSK